jgi:DNA-binding NtrC family response regulator
MDARSSTGPLLTRDRFALFDALARTLTTNPFEPGWDALLEEAAPGFVPGHRAGLWQKGVRDPNLERISNPLAVALLGTAASLEQGVAATPGELAAYTGAAVFSLWDQLGPGFDRLVDDDGLHAPFYDTYASHHRLFFGKPGLPALEPARLFGVLYQAHRARRFISSRIWGASPSAAAARADLWRACGFGDLLTYADCLYRHMNEFPVLVTGETGTGKELAAQCVGWSRYIPFDERTKRFVAKHAADYHARNLCEVPRDLVESALFGHKKGAFTGASADATGYFALPGEHGTLFLDEIGELPEHVQVKLLRPLEGREYVPVGDLRTLLVQGRLVFATNRDLEAMAREGRFRADLYERLNGMRVHMPPLRQMLAEAPEDLRRFVQGFVAGKLDAPDRVELWTQRIVGALRTTMAGHAWPGNTRELRHYVERFVLTGGPPRPPAPPPPADPRRPSGAAAAPPQRRSTPESTCLPSSGLLGPVAKQGNVTVEELERAYVTRVFALTGMNRSATARRTGRNWRTIGRLIDPRRLLRLLKRPPPEDDPDREPE